MSSKPLISVIVPVYGVEKYIGSCISSIKEQSLVNFECIVIDDGSIDRSMTIVKSLINNDARFILLEKENGGQGSARNLGLDYARGDYIAFIDSDDTIEPEFLERMYHRVVETDSDVCTCNVNYVDIYGNAVGQLKNDIKKHLEYEDHLLGYKFISNFMWDKLWKRSLFSSVRFDTNLRTNEDVYIMMDLIFNAKLCSIEYFLYNYLLRPGATSKSIRPTYFQDKIKIKNKQKIFSDLKNFSHRVDYINFCYLKTFVFSCLTTFTRYSDQYYKDVHCLMLETEKEVFTLKNIFKVMKKERKTGLALFLFKVSPTLFHYVSRLWFKNKVA